MRCFEVSLPTFSQLDGRDQAAILAQLVSLFAGPLHHCRLLTFVMPATLERLERERRKLAMSRPDEWERRGLLEEVRLIGDWAGRGAWQRTRHYLLDFEDSVTAADLAHWRIRATPAPPELPIPGDYVEYTDHLAPVIRQDPGDNRGEVPDHSRYRAAMLASYQLARIWDWRHPLAQMITAADGPMVICIDCRRIHPERVTASADFWQGMVANGQDRYAAASRDEAEAALSVGDEAVHHVRVLFMLLDRNLGRLRQRATHLRQTSAQYMKIDRLHGYQAAAARMFTPEVKPAGLPTGHFNTLSRAVAVCAGMWGTGREQPSSGYYVGVSVDEVAPHVCYLDWKGNEPFHGVILGKTGFGKTVGAQALAWRMAEQDTQAIFLEPQGHCRRLLALSGGQHTSYNLLSYETTQLNILDVVYDNPSEQYDHVLTLLALLLDPLGMMPRAFSNPEIAAIRQALQLTYARYDWQEELLTNQELTPTLDTFCHKLYQVAEQTPARSGPTRLATAPVPVGANGWLPNPGSTGVPVAEAAAQLAEEIASLYVYGDYAAAFNAPTNIDLSLKERIVLFDFSQVPERRRALFYYAVLAGIQRQVRRRPRKRAIFVDEIHYMSQEVNLMMFLARLVKTVRTFQAALVLIDQDLEAFLGVEGAQAESMQAGLNVAAGTFVLQNLDWLLTFVLTEAAAGRLLRLFAGKLLPSQLAWLTSLAHAERHGQGMALLQRGGKSDQLYFQLRPSEARYLLGS